MGDTRLLGKDALLRALASCEASPNASLAREREPWLALGLDGDSWRSDSGLLGRMPPWLAEAGALASPSRRYLAYLKPAAGLESYFPSTLVLRVEAGRYSVQTWDCGLASRTGLEIASAPPLVCSPPCSGSALVVIIEPLP